jgi:glucose-1-phosphatase
MERIDLRNIKNIIFDLGVVLLDLDFELSKQKFRQLGLEDLDLLYSFMHANPFFHDYETGKITDIQFVEGIKEMLPATISNNQVLDAWNAIVEGFRQEKIAFVRQISEKYNIYLLSNTNHLHALKYEKQFLEKAGVPMSTYFRKIYYSHQIGVRKPDHRAFRIILNENGLKADETLFVDDQAANLEPAGELMMKTLLFRTDDDLFGLFGMVDNKK